VSTRLHPTARTVHQCASERQPAKADHLSVACFEFYTCTILFMVKIKSAGMGNKTVIFLRLSHIYGTMGKFKHIFTYVASYIKTEGTGETVTK